MLGAKPSRSLSLRLIALLSIALLPLGSIAVFQTYKLVSEAEDVARRDMLARTNEVARAQTELIVEARGATTALGAAVAEVGPDQPSCSAVMRQFLSQHPKFVFAGFIERDGMMRCASSGATTDFSGFESWATFLEDPKPTAVINSTGTSSGVSVLIVNTPVFDQGGTLLGAASVSIPHSLLDDLAAQGIEDVDVAITNGFGAVMSLSGERLGQRLAEMADFSPSRLGIPRSGALFEASEDKTVSIVPIEPFDLFVVGSWSEATTPLSVSTLGTAAPLFPVAMWLASLFVAIFAIQSLVLKHLKKLLRGMRRVSLENIDASYVRLEGAPREISEIGDSYNALLERVSQDALALSEAADDKELLLREVHHRVKNNLQLIASILNMQLRQIESPDAQDVLRRVQKRVMSLAAIHKLLYTDTKIDLVRSDLLLSEIVNNTVRLGGTEGNSPRTSVSLEPVELDPDRALPLALFVTEAVTNAMKYAGKVDGTAGDISVTLSTEDDGRIYLEVCNTLGDLPHTTDAEDGTGLGSKLMAAFVTQLDGERHIERNADSYKTIVEFPKEAPTPVPAEAA